jgi:hypothetical protein
VDTGLWGLNDNVIPREWRQSATTEESRTSRDEIHPSPHGFPLSLEANEIKESVSDRVEVAVVTFLQKNPDSIYLDIAQDLYPRFPGLLTPSHGIVYAVLSSYASKESGAWKLRPEDLAAARRNELNSIPHLIEAIGRRLGYSTRQRDRHYFWEQNDGIERIFYILASALIGRAISETPYPPEQTVIVIPGGRAALAAYKIQRDPALAARVKAYQVVKYRLLRTLIELPILTRETFEEQIAGDPLEKSRAQMILF